MVNKTFNSADLFCSRSLIVVTMVHILQSNLKHEVLVAGHSRSGELPRLAAS